MQYEKLADGSYVPLKQHNVDTGMGVERTVAMLQGRKTVFETEMFTPVMDVISAESERNIQDEEKSGQAFRVIADHLRSSVFILGDEQGITPGNLGQGYVLRRLIRRSIRYAKKLGLGVGFSRPVAECVIENYKHKDIAELLGIDEKTSRSRLLRARLQVQKELYKRCITKLVV